MENRKIILDGVSYNCFTDEELEDFKTTIAYEERKKNKDFKLIEFEDFIKKKKKKTNLTLIKTLLLYML